MDNLTDAVFGIAITLLIFNLENPNSFKDLLEFTKTLPATLISISFVMLIWTEHARFFLIYQIEDTLLSILNTLFIALVIFYVYPLRFLTSFLTNLFFQTEISLEIKQSQIPELMIYYGLIAFGLYFMLYLFHRRAWAIRNRYNFNEYELLDLRAQGIRMVLMFSVPLVSIALVMIFKSVHVGLAGFIGGLAYNLYWPVVLLWGRWITKKGKALPE